MKRLILFAAVVSGVCTWSACADDIPLRETAQGTVFGTERFSVVFDAKTGWAGDVLCDGRAVVNAAPTAQAFDIRQDETWVTGGGAPVEGQGVERVAPDTVRSRIKAGAWEVDAYVQLVPEARMLRRWFDITWRGEGDTKIKAFWFQGGALKLTDAGGYFYPGQYPPRRRGVADLEPGRKTSSGRSPYSMIGETGDGWSAVWVLDELQPYADRGSAGAQEEPGMIHTTQSFSIQGHMRPGVAQRVGDAWLWLQPNDAETALRRMPEWFVRVGQVPPEGRPNWLKHVILYSLHPGGTIGSDCKDWGGFPSATALLPHIRALGCNALWLMPLEDKSIYWPRDYYKLQEGIGTPDDYKAFTARAHELGMRVWQDSVPHGGCNEYPRAKEHPEWLAQKEDGSTLYYWCFDFNWPTWIDYMRGVTAFYTREYNLDGFRIDACGGSYIPNWNPAIPYARASHAQAQGGFAMQRALREEVRKLRPDGANLAEVGASVHGAVSDSTYDFDLCYSVLHDFRKVSADVFVPRLRRWLHEQQCAEIPDLVRMRHVESHDSLRSGLWYGADAQRALVALSAWIHGIPMVYQEMEDGHFDAYRRIFHVRSHTAELSEGDADYLSVDAPPGVFACLRGGKSVVLVNLNGTETRGAVSVPNAAASARDLMTGAAVAFKDGRADVTLAPFGYTVLRFGGDALPALTSLAKGTPLPDAPLGQPEVTVADGLRTTTLALPAATERWFACTAEGVFASPFRVRHPKFDGTVGPIYRLPQGTATLWDSRLHPFGAATEFARIGVELGGRRLVFAFDPKRLPLSVELLDRVGDRHGPHLRVTAPEGDAAAGGYTMSEENADAPLVGGTGDARLTCVGGGWQFENAFIRARIARTGALVGLWRKADGDWRQVIGAGSLYTDRGFSSERFAQENDVEATIRIQRNGDKLLLAFEGEMRGFQRFAKHKAGIRFKTRYLFDDSGEFRLELGAAPQVPPQKDGAYLAWMMTVPGAADVAFTDGVGEIAADKRGTGRVAQTAESGRLPTGIRIGRDGGTLRLDAEQWTGPKPGNVFMHGDQLHLAWRDGARGTLGNAGEAEAWAGVTLKVSSKE